MGAGADDDLVELAAQGGGGVDLHVEADLDVVLLQLTLVPAQQGLVGLLEAHGGGGDVQAAQLAGLFEDDGGVAALLEHQGALHAADAAADDGDLLGLAGGNDLVLVVLHGAGGQGAAGQVQRVVHGLHIGRALGLVEAEAGVVTVDAGLDVLYAVLQDLVDPLGVHQVLAGDAHGVQTSGGDLLGGLGGVHLTGADHGLGGEVLDVFHLGEVAVLGHIDRGMGPVPGIVGAVVAVEHIVAGILQVLDGLLGLGHIAAELHELLAGNGALAEALGLGHHGVTQGHGEVLAADGLDGLDDFHSEAVAVFEGAAVLVGTVVHVGNGELVQQIALMHRVDLDTVNAGILQELGGLGKGVHHLVDLLHGQGAGFAFGIPPVGGGGGRGGDVVHVQEGLAHGAEGLVLEHLDHDLVDSHGTAHTGGQLNKQLGAGLVELRQPLGQVLEHLFVLVQPAAAHGVADTLHTRQHQAHVVLGAVQDVVGRFLVEVTGLQPAEQGRTAHRGLHDTVLDLHVADLPGGKQSAVFLVHSVFLLIFSAYCRILLPYYSGFLGEVQQRNWNKCRFSGKSVKITGKKRQGPPCRFRLIRFQGHRPAPGRIPPGPGPGPSCRGGCGPGSGRTAPTYPGGGPWCACSSPSCASQPHCRDGR